jgi:hypothetical protein
MERKKKDTTSLFIFFSPSQVNPVIEVACHVSKFVGGGLQSILAFFGKGFSAIIYEVGSFLGGILAFFFDIACSVGKFFAGILYSVAAELGKYLGFILYFFVSFSFTMFSRVIANMGFGPKSWKKKDPEISEVVEYIVSFIAVVIGILAVIICVFMWLRFMLHVAIQFLKNPEPYLRLLFAKDEPVRSPNRNTSPQIKSMRIIDYM